MMLIWESGVRSGRISRQRFVDLVATRPAQLFGLAPRKGLIEVGADADLVVWDPDQPRTLTAGSLHTKAGYTLYEGTKVSASPRFVLSRGNVVVSPDGARLVRGAGRYVHRERAGAPV